MRAPSPYIIFCTETRPQIEIDYPNSTFGEKGKILGTMWAQLSAEEKAHYTQKSADKKAALDKAMVSQK